MDLVTGADGFIGSHLVESLVGVGQRVRAFAQYNARNHWGWLEDLDENVKRDVEVFVGDLRDSTAVRNAVRGCDRVFHLGALIAIPYSYQAPSEYVSTNVGGTLHVMEAARDEGVSLVVHTSTSEVYGSARYVPMDENHPLQAQSPYSASKIAADKIAESFWLSYEIPLVTLMILLSCPTQIVTCLNPSRASCRIKISTIGISATGIRGLGMIVVYGANRVPRPPARITALISHVVQVALV